MRHAGMQKTCKNIQKMSSNMFRKILFSGLFIFLISHVSGQEVQSDTNRSHQKLRGEMESKLQEAERASAPATESGDLGEQIMMNQNGKPWNFVLESDIGESWNSNVGLTDRGHQTDFLITHDDAVTGTFKFTDEFLFTGNYRYTAARYGRLTFQNFDAHNAGGNFSYQLPDNYAINTGLQGTTIYGRPNGNTVYEEADWSFGVSKVAPLNFTSWLKDKASLLVGFQTDDVLARPNDFDRVEASPYTGVSYIISPTMMGQTLYQWQYQHYQKAGRKDYNNTFLENFSWTPYQWLTFSAFVNYTMNDSEVRPYSVFSTGGSVVVSWTF